MKIKLRTTYAGPAGTHASGSIVDMPDDEAKGLIDGGYAAQVGDAPEAPPAPSAEPEPEPEVETAAVEVVETAEGPSAKKGWRKK